MSDWNTFFISIRKYLEYFRSCDHLPSVRNFPNVSSMQVISEYELAGLISWSELATAVAKNDYEARQQMYEDRQWNCIDSVIGLLTCSIPLILKKKLYEFIAALAIDECAAVNIWNCLLSEGICVQLENGKLTGIQQDLEEQECVLKVYDCSEGFLTLMKELFSHKTRPGTQQVAPYIQFIVKSIICQFITRSYNDSDQMWDLVKLGLDCLYELLKTFYVTQSAVSNKTTEIQLLHQLLNDTSLLRSLFNVLVEGSNELKEIYPRNIKRDEAALSVIRLIYIAVSYRFAFADSIRSIGSNLMICSLEALMFSPLPNRSNLNCLTLLCFYINENDYFIKHTFYIFKILRELCCQRPSFQKQIIQSIISCQKSLTETVAHLTSIFSFEVNVNHIDLINTNIENYSTSKIRGEIIRILFETFVDSIESDPKTPNIAYLLLGFDLQNISKCDIFNNNANSITCLHNLLEISNVLATSDDLLNVPFCGLFEPTLRVLFKLLSFESASSPVILRILRSYDNLILKLATSSIFRNIEKCDNEKMNLITDAKYSALIFQKSIQCIILELIAIELSSLLRSRQIEQSRKLIAAILFEKISDNGQSFSNTTNGNENNNKTTDHSNCQESAVLWCLLEQSKVDLIDLDVPICNKFDSHKVDELLRFCVHKNSCNIEQFDIEYLSLLLNTEINSIVNSEIGIIKEEARDILDYCAQHNAKNLLEGACVHLLSGWLSVVNVLALHSPLFVISDDINKKVLIDALFLLKNYCFCIGTDAEITGMISSCMFRLVRAICSFYRDKTYNKNLLKNTLFPIIFLLLQCLILPRYSKCVRFKLDIYGSILCIFDTCNQKNFDEKKNLSVISLPKLKNEKLDNEKKINLPEMMEDERNREEEWSKYFEPMIAEIVDTFSMDITYGTLKLKIAATACLSDIIREDIVHSKNVSYHFVYSGAMACVLDTLNRVIMDFKEDKAKLSVEKCRDQVLLVKALFSLFVRLASSEYGWAALINGKVFEKLIIIKDEENKIAEKSTKNSNTNGLILFRELLDTMSKF